MPSLSQATLFKMHILMVKIALHYMIKKYVYFIHNIHVYENVNVHYSGCINASQIYE
jgi:hypothetical protein